MIVFLSCKTWCRRNADLRKDPSGLGVGRRDVFFCHFPIGPGAPHVEELEFEPPNHIYFGIKTAALEYALMAVIIVAVLIVVTSVSIEFAVMRMARKR
jgi:hypothetical protein